MSARRRALLLLPALAACYAYAPPRGWAAPPPPPASPRPPVASRIEPEEDPREGQEGQPAAPEPSTGGPPLGETSEERLRIVEAARRWLGRRFAGDCSAFVRSVLREAGVELGPLPSARSMSESLHLASLDVKVPHPGDLIFFHDTFDRNRDGRVNDPWTHVALVEAVEEETVWILHRGGSGIVRLRMDRTHPHDERANDPIRMRTRHDAPGTRYLTAELFSAYGSVVE